MQVSAIVQEDNGTPLHQHIQTAHVSLMHNRTAMLTKSIEPDDYNEQNQQFILFFINPPIQRNAYVEFSVELMDGRATKCDSQVSIGDLLPDTGIASNPVMAGLPIKDHTNTWDAMGRERKPD